LQVSTIKSLRATHSKCYMKFQKQFISYDQLDYKVDVKSCVVWGHLEEFHMHFSTAIGTLFTILNVKTKQVILHIFPDNDTVTDFVNNQIPLIRNSLSTFQKISFWIWSPNLSVQLFPHAITAGKITAESAHMRELLSKTLV
jgi:hypothetical protein